MMAFISNNSDFLVDIGSRGLIVGAVAAGVGALSAVIIGVPAAIGAISSGSIGLVHHLAQAIFGNDLPINPGLLGAMTFTAVSLACGLTLKSIALLGVTTPLVALALCITALTIVILGAEIAEKTNLIPNASTDLDNFINNHKRVSVV